MSTIVTRTGKGSALSFAEMDANFNNLNTDKLENITGQSIGNLSDVVITGTPADNEVVAYDTSTSKFINQTAAEAGLAALTSFSVGAEASASGDGAIAYNNGTGEFTYTPPTAAGIGALANVVEDSSPQLGGNLDIQANSITTSTSDGDITLTANGAGVVNVSSAGGMTISDTGASGFGVIAGASGKGIALATNDFAQAATDPQVVLTNGGGATLTAGSGSALALTGSTISMTGAATLSNLKTFTETVHTSSTTTGTYAPSIANGTIHNVPMTGSMTINAFTSPADGQTITLFFNGTGGTFTLTLGSDIKTPAGTLALTSGGLDIVTITCIDATTPIYVATAINNFQ